MKPKLRTFALVTATAAATAAATTVLPIGAGHPAPVAAPLAASPAAVATAAQAIEAPMVTGLPDFTQLVERVGPAVVSIEATGSARGASVARERPRGSFA